MAKNVRKSRNRVEKRHHRLRSVFVSLPSRKRIEKFVKDVLEPRVRERLKRLKFVDYTRWKQAGDFTQKITKEILHSNALVAFLHGNNPNVLVEVGQALSLGKPIVYVGTDKRSMPTLLNHQLYIQTKKIIPDSIETEKIIEALEFVVFGDFFSEDFNIFRQEHNDGLLRGRKGSSGKRKGLHVNGPTHVLHQAIELFKVGDFERSIKAYERCIRLGYRTEEVYLGRADACFLLGETVLDVGKARKAYETLVLAATEGLKRFPESVGLLKQKANGLIKTNRIREGLQLTEELWSRTKNVVFCYNLACCHALLDDEWNALKHLREALRMDRHYQGQARLDPDFDSLWENKLFQAIVFDRP